VTRVTCRDVEPALLDGTLRAPEAVPPEVASHLGSCPACAARAALWRELGPALAETAPEPPDALRARRIENAVMQRLLVEPLGREQARPRRMGLTWMSAAAGAAAALVLVAGLWALRRSPAAPPWGATLTSTGGSVARDGRAARAGERLVPGQALALADAGEAELALDGAAHLSLIGPARLVLEGSPQAVILRLEQGKLTADVIHRAPTETFWVAVRGGRVEVRGTRFHVSSDGERTSVDVLEGRVLVRDDAGRESLVGPGESVGVPLSPGPVPSAPEAPALEAPGLEPAPPPPSCDGLLRACQGSARNVRAALRSGESERARRVLAEGARAARQAPGACTARLVPCDDELRYLNAEMLQVQGHLEAAAHAFRALDRPGAPPPTRQNALYAAARLEQRLGHAREASAEFERALDAAPRGALGDEALGGAMESAAAAGDGARAAALARRYLSEFPRGLMAPAARRLAGPDARAR
jgi:ferric-dicitrate binding protein FerR (iron transport regulator)